MIGYLEYKAMKKHSRGTSSVVKTTAGDKEKGTKRNT